MRFRNLVFILFAGLSAPFYLAAQEIDCANAADDDGDGFIDCADSDCELAAACEDSFISSGADCVVNPPPSTGFNMADNPAVSGQNTVDTQSKTAIGDVDGDGVPDVVATSKWNQTIRVVATTDDQADGSDAGDIKADFKTPGAKIFPNGNYFFEQEVGIADIDKDGLGEMWSIISKRQNANSTPQEFYLVGFTYDLGPPKPSLEPLFDAVLLQDAIGDSERPGIFGIADFDGDMLVEIYLKDKIYAAESGELLADGAAGDWDKVVNSAPVAVDILPGGNLELVSGSLIYTVPNLNRGSTATLTVAQDMNALAGDDFFPKLVNDLIEYGEDNFSSTSVADFDDDGDLDVFISGALNDPNGKTAVFYWDISAGTVQTHLPIDPMDPNGWPWGAGRVNMGDIDGDGLLEAVYVAGNQMYALELVGGVLTQKWNITINDSRSGVIAVTVYDFQNDGVPEIVYRDAQNIAIIDGPTGLTTLWSYSCKSHTWTEGPIVADMNGDGDTDIVVPCFRNDATFSINAPIQQQALGELRVFFSDENDWLPTRKVWNQGPYFVSNINDDLTVPFPQLAMTQVFGTVPCSNGVPGPNTPLNVFLNQVPNLGPDGCPVYPAADIDFVQSPDTTATGTPGSNSFILITPPTCPDEDFSIAFRFINSGDVAITDDMPFTMYNGDPTMMGSTKLGTDIIQLVDFKPQDTVVKAGFSVAGTGGPFQLFVVLNDDGTTPIPITLPTTNLQECEFANNIASEFVNPLPFGIFAEKLADNNKCQDTIPDNGAAQAFGILAGDTVQAGNTFYWFQGTTVGNLVDADFVGAVQTGLGTGPYAVITVNDALGCTSDTALVTIDSTGVSPPQPVITQDAPLTNCGTPDGQLSATVGGVTTGFNFEWFEGGIAGPLVAVGPVASGLDAIGYALFVTDQGSGCQNLATETVPSAVVIPIVTTNLVSNVTSCNDPNGGAVSANVGGDITSYNFEWSNGASVKSTPDFIGSTYSGIPAGQYTVEAVDKITDCRSFPQTEIVGDVTEFPAISIIRDADQTSCNTNTPNGQLTASASTAGGEPPLGYTFQWFEGINTLPANEIFTTSGASNETASQLKAVSYTVLVTNNSSGCQLFKDTTVLEMLANPVLDPPTSTPFTSCATPDGSVSATVSGGTAGYAFYWFDGIVGPIPPPPTFWAIPTLTWTPATTPWSRLT